MRSGGTVGAKLDIALQVLAGVDFEATVNAKFLSLTSILEVLAAPMPRPDACSVLVDELLASLEDRIAAADDETRTGFEDMRKSAVHWKKESIRSAVRRLGKRVAEVTGEDDPPAAGLAARNLYDKRSKSTHEAKPVSGDDLRKLHHLVLDAILVEAKRPDLSMKKL